MPAFDKCHREIVRALIAAGWNIVTEQVYLDDFHPSYIDLQIEMNGEYRYIEIKCFPGNSVTQELYVAFGQIILYQALLLRTNNPIPLYMAMPHELYDQIFSFTEQYAIDHYDIKIVLIDRQMERIVRWIE
ncbi:MAG: element excision factor XisH family protein [Anaerolineae bacterium]|nr:hypothetical protein [Anaerolineae bacterium]